MLDFPLPPTQRGLWYAHGVALSWCHALPTNNEICLTANYQQAPNRHNSLGFRGEELAPNTTGVARIAFVGGSTMYGEGVPDYHMSLPDLLAFGLAREGKPVQSINAGCPGWTSLETLLNLQLRLLELEPDYVVFYHGINDVLPRMVWPATAYRGDMSGWLCRS